MNPRMMASKIVHYTLGWMIVEFGWEETMNKLTTDKIDEAIEDVKGFLMDDKEKRA